MRASIPGLIAAILSVSFVLLAFALLSACGRTGRATAFGGHGAGITADAGHHRSGAGSPPKPDSTGSAIAALPTPEGADPRVFVGLKKVLTALLEKRMASGKVVSGAPSGDSGKIKDLAFDPIANKVTWSYVNVGDYDLTGEVGISDITPIAVYYMAGTTDGQGDDAYEAWVDGSGNGEVGVDDITPIALNYLSDVAEYAILGSDDPLGSFTELGRVAFSSGHTPSLVPGFPKVFDYDLSANTYKYVAVTPVGGTGTLGTMSDPVDAVIPVAGWYMAGKDAAHTSRSDIAAAGSPTFKWRTMTGDMVTTGPVIADDGTVYAISWDGQMYAINPDGSLKWNYPIQSQYASPAIGPDGTVYAPSDDGYLYAVNPVGTQKWRYNLGGSNVSPIVDSQGNVYIGAFDGTVYALDPAGSLKWSYLCPSGVVAAAAVDGAGAVYVGTSDYSVVAINPDGSLKWTYTAGDMVNGSPVIAPDGTVYVSCFNGALYAVDSDGNFKWLFVTGDAIQMAPALGADGTLYFSSLDSNFYAVNPDGSEKWAYLSAYTIISPPTIDSTGVIFCGTFASNLLAIKPDGTLKWEYDAGDLVQSQPAIGSDGTIYFGCTDGGIYALGQPEDMLPVAALTANPLTGDYPLDVAFDASASTDQDGTVAGYKWDWNGDGANDFDSGATPTAQYTYGFPGTYNATVTAIDNRGGSAKASVTIDVTGVPPFFERENNDDSTQANDLPAFPFTTADVDGSLGSGTGYSGYDGDATDWYRITPGVTGLYTITLHLDSGTGDLDLYLYDSGGIYLTSAEGVTGTETVSYYLTAPGTYYISGEVYSGYSDYTLEGSYSTQQWQVTDVDTASYATYASLAIVDGNPAISYYDSLTSSLKFVRALDALGDTWGTPVEVAPVGMVDWYAYTSLVVVNGNPAIAYHNFATNRLMYVRADDPDGAVWGGAPVTVDNRAGSGYQASLALIGGVPGIAYEYEPDTSTSYIEFVLAGDADGVSWAVPVQVDAGGGGSTCLAEIDGRPAISYFSSYLFSLGYVRADDANGSSWPAPMAPDPGFDLGWETTLLVVDGNPAISYFDQGNYLEKYVRASDVDGASWNAPVVAAPGVSGWGAMAIVGGVPAVAFQMGGAYYAGYVYAADADGVAWNTPGIAHVQTGTGWHSKLVDIGGKPAVSYDTTGSPQDGALKFARLISY